MKYIRTKDGIYRSGKYFIDGYESDWNGKLVKIKVPVCSTIPKEDILKRANTIEELCDEFVVNINKGYLMIDHYDKKLLEQDATKNGAKVFGAIWTDKGLVYVAKMNSNGELELL